MPGKRQPKQIALDRAKQIGVSIPTLNSWKRCGVDVWDDDQVRRRLARMRNLPPNLKPEWHPKVATPPADVEPIQQDEIERLQSDLASCTDKHQAQTIKTKIDGALAIYKLREAAGKYVAKSTVEEALIRIAAAVKAAVLRMEADLPPMLEGMDPAAMQRVIRGKVDEVMTMLSDEAAKIWETDEN